MRLDYINIETDIKLNYHRDSLNSKILSDLLSFENEVNKFIEKYKNIGVDLQEAPRTMQPFNSLSEFLNRKYTSYENKKYRRGIKDAKFQQKQRSLDYNREFSTLSIKLCSDSIESG